MSEKIKSQGELLVRVAEALERLAPAPARFDMGDGDAFVWHADTGTLTVVEEVNRLPLTLLKSIDMVSAQLLENTKRFANGFPANNALLWGARGMGKSSLVKAVHGSVVAENGAAKLALVEIHREDIASLPHLLAHLRTSDRRVILFCDDLTFGKEENDYKALKAVLEGGLEGRPENVVFYATSNRRHMMPREMIENEQSTAINPGEAVEEMVSLSDRFGLWLGFHSCNQDDYLAMVEGYARHFGLGLDGDKLRRRALEWSMTRGGRSGRVAWQFIQDLAGELGVSLKAGA